MNSGTMHVRDPSAKKKKEQQQQKQGRYYNSYAKGSHARGSEVPRFNLPNAISQNWVVLKQE